MPARRMMDQRRCAGKVACRSGSALNEGLGRAGGAPRPDLGVHGGRLNVRGRLTWMGPAEAWSHRKGALRCGWLAVALALDDLAQVWRLFAGLCEPEQAPGVRVNPCRLLFVCHGPEAS